MTHKENILQFRNLFPSISCHDYKGMPNEAFYNKLFEFAQGTIDRSSHFGIVPGIFVFETCTDINAYAGKHDDIFIIRYCIGTLNFLLNNFQYRPDIINADFFSEYRDLELNSNYPLNDLLFQSCSTFTLYHEFGHLIQKSDFLVNGLHEELSGTQSFDLNRHVLEIDADVHAAKCVAGHCHQYIRDWIDSYTAKDVEDFVSFISAGIFVYLMNFPSMQRPLYFKEYSHPHPIVRIVIIIAHVADYFEFLIKNKSSELKINKGKIITNCFVLTEKLCQLLGSAHLVNLFKNSFQDHGNDIFAYADELIEEVNKLDRSAHKKWNEYGGRVNGTIEGA